MAFRQPGNRGTSCASAASVARIPLMEPGETVRVRDQRWRVARCIGYGDTVILDVGGCDTGNRGVRAKFVLPIERVERLPVSRTPRIVRPARWRAVARLELGEAVPRIDSLRAAARANVSAIPFQLEPALAITRGLGCRMLIADDVGLGKTIQAGMIIAEALVRVPDGRTLVVCPAALRDQWLHEMEQRFGLRASILDSTTAARAPQVSPGTNPWAAHPRRHYLHRLCEAARGDSIARILDLGRRRLRRSTCAVWRFSTSGGGHRPREAVARGRDAVRHPALGRRCGVRTAVRPRRTARRAATAPVSTHAKRRRCIGGAAHQRGFECGRALPSSRCIGRSSSTRGSCARSMVTAPRAGALP